MSHIKILISFLITILIVAFLYSCSDDEPQPIIEANRTILVYMVAGNSLGTGNYDTADINEMIAASETNSFNNGRYTQKRICRSTRINR